MTARKICVIGEPTVGKTSLTRRYVLNAFSNDYRATLGVHLYKFVDQIGSAGQSPIELVIWDIEGAPQPSPMMERYLGGASAALIVGDLTRRDPLRALGAYAEMFEGRAPGRPICFALNKIDLIEAPNVAAKLDLPGLGRRFDAPTLMTSALSAQGVREAFHALGDRILAFDL